MQLRISISLLLLSLILALPTLAIARPRPSKALVTQQRALALEDQAQTALDVADPKKALALYEQALALDPSGSPVTTVAQQEKEWLEDRSEDDFRPLSLLLRIKSEKPVTAKSLDAFEHEVDSFPPGPVRQESRGFVADEWLRMLHDPVRGLAAHQKWLAEPGLDPIEREVAEGGLRTAEGRVKALQARKANATPANNPSTGSPRSVGHLATRVGVIAGLFLVVLGAGVTLRRRQR